MVEESPEYVCELHCLAAGVFLLTAVMWLYCGPCADSCHVNTLKLDKSFFYVPNSLFQT